MMPAVEIAGNAGDSRASIAEAPPASSTPETAAGEVTGPEPSSIRTPALTIPQTVIIPGFEGAEMWGYCTSDKKPCLLDGIRCAPAEGLMPIQNINWEQMQKCGLKLRLSLGGNIRNKTDKTKITSTVAKAAPIVVLDYDHIYDADTGDFLETVDKNIRDEVTKLRTITYCEISQSGTGLHAILMDTLGIQKVYKGNQQPEIFGGDKFILITSKKCPESPITAENADDLLQLIHKRVVAPVKPTAAAKTPNKTVSTLRAPGRKAWHPPMLTAEEFEIWCKMHPDAKGEMVESGYIPVGDRLISPHSKSGNAGVWPTPDGKIYDHHASDTAYNDGKTHDAWDVYVTEKFAGDTEAAALAAREEVEKYRSHRQPKHQESGVSSESSTSSIGDGCPPIPTLRVDDGKEEPIYSETVWNKAWRIYSEGKMVDHLVSEVRKEHTGDELIVRGLISSAIYMFVEKPLEGGGIHIGITGEAGTGKTHVVKSVLKRIPPQHYMKDIITPQALFYEKTIKSKTIICIDDQRLDEKTQENFKNLTSWWDEGITKRSVVNGAAKTLKIPPRCPIWTLKVEQNGDEQILDRQLSFWVTDTTEQRRAIQRAALAKNIRDLATRNEHEDIEVCRALFDMLKPMPITVPFAEDIQMDRDMDPRTVNMLSSLMSANTLAAAHLRETTDDGYIIATREDFDAAAQLLNPLLRNKGGSQRRKITAAQWCLLNTFVKKLEEEGEEEIRLTYSQLTQLTKYPKQKLTYLLQGRHDSEHNSDGLYGICSALTPERQASQYVTKNDRIITIYEKAVRVSKTLLTWMNEEGEIGVFL